MVELLSDSCCLTACNPAISRSLTGEHTRISVRVDGESKATVIYQGEKWNEDNFVAKCNASGLGDHLEKLDPVERVVPDAQVIEAGMQKDATPAVIGLLLSRVATEATGKKFVCELNEEPGGDTTFKLSARGMHTTSKPKRVCAKRVRRKQTTQLTDVLAFVESACGDMARDHVELLKSGMPMGNEEIERKFRAMKARHIGACAQEVSDLEGWLADVYYDDVVLLADLIADHIHGWDNRNEILDEMDGKGGRLRQVVAKIRE